MKKSDFIVFILTNGRPDKVVTYNTLRRCGYTGEIRLIVDNLDKKKDEYIERFKDEVIVFDKPAWAAKTDSGDNSGDMRAAVYARNASFEIAEQLGYRYFIQLEDDYVSFYYVRGTTIKKVEKRVKSLDKVFSALFRFLATTPTISIAMAQGGDFIGGSGNDFNESIKLKRKCMNSFCFDTQKPAHFVGRMNDDVNTYTTLGSRGKLFFTTNLVKLNQVQTQAVAGGMTEVYKDGGTYLKTFHTIIRCPAFVKVALMANRIHHCVLWKYGVPKILNQNLRKLSEL